MAQTGLEPVDLTSSPLEDATVQPVAAPLAISPVSCGSITITFFDGGGHMVPEVSFAPLGRINPNTIERFLPFIYQAIQREQVRERQGG